MLALGVGQLKRTPAALLFVLALGWSIEPAHLLWKRQLTTPQILNTTTKEAFLQRQLPDNYPIYQKLELLGAKRVWLVWMRGYLYYLPIEARVDSVFGAWRFEQLLEQEKAAIHQQLKEEGFDYIVINHRFFLVDDNAELTEGRTRRLQHRFEELLAHKILIPQEQYRGVTIYQVKP